MIDRVEDGQAALLADHELVDHGGRLARVAHPQRVVVVPALSLLAAEGGRERLEQDAREALGGGELDHVEQAVEGGLHDRRLDDERDRSVGPPGRRGGQVLERRQRLGRGARHAAQPVVDRRVEAVERDVDVEHAAVDDRGRELFGDQGAIGDEADRQAQARRLAEQFRQVGAQQRLAAGDVDLCAGSRPARDVAQDVDPSRVESSSAGSLFQT